MAGTLSIEKRSDRGIEFVIAYVENGDNATQAVIACDVPNEAQELSGIDSRID